MGQKVHPTGIRLGIVKKHTSVWFAEGREYADNLLQDLEVRAYVKKRLASASVSRVDIERPAQTAKLTIYTARPGIVIGKKGEDVEALRNVLTKKMGVPVQINIEEIRKPDLDAQLVADSVAQQLERRVMFRRAMKRAVQNAMRQGAEGIKVQVGGRLGGADGRRNRRRPQPVAHLSRQFLHRGKNESPQERADPRHRRPRDPQGPSPSSSMRPSGSRLPWRHPTGRHRASVGPREQSKAPRSRYSSRSRQRMAAFE